MVSKKRRRFGRVRELPSGRFQARYPGPDGLLRTAPHTFDREADADQWLGEVETDLRRGDWTDPDAGKVSVQAYARAWITDRPELAVRTVELYEGLLVRHIAPSLGTVMLGDLSAARVRRWRRELLDQGVGKPTVAKAYRLLRAVLNTAVDPDRLIKFNPCAIKGAGQETSPERPIVSVDEALKAADLIEQRYRLLVLLATFASLRFAEMIGLQRADIDTEHAVVYVRRQAVQPSKGEMFESDPKSAAGTRKVVVPAFLVPEIRRHLETYVKPQATAWVFVGPKGARPKRSNFHTIWDRARKAAGVPHLHLHDLRHTGNTMAAETGAHLRELMARLGHSSTRAALIYLHAREERGATIAAGIDGMVTAAKQEKGHATGTDGGKGAPKPGPKSGKQAATSKNKRSG